MTAPVLMIAGCGDLGLRLAAQPLLADWRIHGLRRDTTALPASILPVPGDFTQPACPDGWPAGPIDYLLYSASPQRRDEDGYRLAYVEGLRNVLAWLALYGQHPRRLLFVSSVGVYGQHDGEWVDERSPTEPDGYTGQVMLEAERLALASGLPATLVRLAGLYHPSRPWLQGQVRAGMQAQQEPPQYSNRIHRDDAATLLATLLLAEQGGTALEDCYLGVDDAPAPLHEVVDWLRQRLGIDAPDGPAIQRRAGSKRCSNARARALGWMPRYPSYREGYADEQE
ncbi:NAD-dependent epimerase/dehydratase family protein [Stutzerimonas kirkiae]|uniref:NAD-dependent epimerase/dehydratase family protein n=1 Tax=Stutzerimonas kirkiae TaxID=2211392 RepID=UPI001038397F|nr:NAD-dependent epimerase/dehydratase family protein [Stutzerimonas kirkiae]TBV14329.1 NAD(P)-dependent oxidoreductase [Stutzerimonas kirkiae]